MKLAAKPKFKNYLRRGAIALGLWLSLLSPVMVQAAAGSCNSVHSGADRSATYHIMARIFEGGLQGVTQQIPKLSSMTDRILLSGLHPQTVDSMPDGLGGTTENAFGYWPSDHSSINPQIGSFADLKKLTETARSHNLQVMIDAVPGHFGYQPRQKSHVLRWDGASYHRIDQIPEGIVRWTEDIQRSDWETFNHLHDPTEILRHWDQIFSRKRLFGLPGFNHKRTDVQDAMVKAYTRFVDAGVTGFRIDAALYMDRVFLTEFINRLNHYAEERGQRLTFYIEALVAHDSQLSAIQRDVDSRLNRKDNVYFFDFPLMYELRRLIELASEHDYRPDPDQVRAYHLDWLKGFDQYRRQLGIDRSRLIPTIVNHDFGYPIASKATEAVIHALSHFKNGQAPLIYQGIENGSADAAIHRKIEDINADGRLTRMIQVFNQHLSSYAGRDVTIQPLGANRILMKRITPLKSLFLLVDLSSADIASTGVSPAHRNLIIEHMKLDQSINPQSLRVLWSDQYFVLVEGS